MKSSPHYVRIESTISGPGRSNGTRPSPDFSPRLRDKIWEWPGDEATFLYHTHICTIQEIYVESGQISLLHGVC